MGFMGFVRPSGHSGKPSGRLWVEMLEDRVVPSGTWATLTNPLPWADGAQTLMLLSDGTVMVHGGSGSIASSSWYDLIPDSTGSYINGSWSKLGSMNTGRLYFTSDVLKDGRVFVVGGEYSGPDSEQNNDNTGEIYDPVADTWMSITTFPQTEFGDDPSEVLPDGRVLVGYINGPETYLYDPATNSWSPTGSKLRNDRSSEETWVKLADDSILSYDIFSSIRSGAGLAQRYVPSQGQWVDAGALPDLLSSTSNDYEIGPALVLPDGRAFFLGATGKTTFYIPPTNAADPGSWTAGPAIPNNLIAADAPGAILPNGHVLFAAGPAHYKNPSPTSIFEFDPATDTFTDVTPNNFNLKPATYATTMLVLPTGQMMLANGTGIIDVFTPDGAPNDSWRPTITKIIDNGNDVFTLEGTQLNGLSEGASYGDDAEMASNYPIIRLTDANGNVSFARTFNWSSTGVATGSTPESVDFTFPEGDALGPYLVNVIANGIASDPVLNVRMGPFNDFALLADPNNPSKVNVANNGWPAGEMPVSSFPSIVVAGNNPDHTLAPENAFVGIPIVLRTVMAATPTPHYPARQNGVFNVLFCDSCLMSMVQNDLIKALFYAG
jgi:hypothetical protein